MYKKIDTKRRIHFIHMDVYSRCITLKICVQVDVVAIGVALGEITLSVCLSERGGDAIRIRRRYDVNACSFQHLSANTRKKLDEKSMTGGKQWCQLTGGKQWCQLTGGKK